MQNLRKITSGVLWIVVLFLTIPQQVFCADNGCDSTTYYLSLYDKTPLSEKYTVANKFLSMLDREQITDTLYEYSNISNVDSITMFVYYWAAEYYFATEQYEQSISSIQRSIPYMERLGNSVAVSDVHHLQGINYIRLSDFEQAANSFHRSYEIDKTLGDPSRLSSTLNSLASNYYAARQPELAEKYILEAIAINSTIDEPKRMSVLLGTASEISHALKKEQQALHFAQSGYDIEVRLGRKQQQGKRLSQMAVAYLGLQENQKAQECLQKSIVLLEETNSIHSVGICENQLGYIALNDKQYDEASKHYLRAAEIFRNQKDLYNEAIARQGLSQSLKESNPAEAIRQSEIYQSLKDSIYKQQTAKTLSIYNAQYGNEQLQSELEAMRKKEKRHKIMAISVSVSVFVLVIVVGVAAYILYKKKQRQKEAEIKELQAQNQQLIDWYKNAVVNTNALNNEISEQNRAFLNETSNIINELLEKGANVDITTISTRLRMTPTQLRLKLMEVLGTTPRSYILRLRLEKARYLMETNPTMTIADIAIKCGYEETSNFIHAFKRQFGVNPSTYRKTISREN